MRTVFWEDTQLKMIDQRILPSRFEILSFKDHVSVARAIKDMVVRGAPAIGATAAFGMALAAYESKVSSRDRKSTRLNSSHSQISYAVFCLKKKKKETI